MKRLVCLLAAVLVLTAGALARTIPEDLTDAAPKAAEDLLEGATEFGPKGFSDGIGRILRAAGEQVAPIFRQRLKGAALVLLAVILCGAVRGTGGEEINFTLSMAGALAVTTLTAGSLDWLIGLGWETIRELDDFSKTLLPVLAAATAASGAVTTATFQQVTAVFLAEALVGLIDGLFMPMVYLYIGILTASCALGEERLALLAAGLKRVITGALTGTLLLFTVYLSVFRVISGSVDGAAVRTAKAAVSNVVPVVGGILAEASEAMLVGAGLLKSSVGVFGMLAVLAACVYPFLHLGIQYLLYKAAALLASTAGAPELCRLLDGLGGAFGLVLGMTAGCALLLLISILSFVSAVVP